MDGRRIDKIQVRPPASRQPSPSEQTRNVLASGAKPKRADPQRAGLGRCPAACGHPATGGRRQEL